MWNYYIERKKKNSGVILQIIKGRYFPERGEMIQEDDITVAEKIREKDKNVLIIYVTSHITYIQQVFPAPPFQFLIKPVDDKLMEQCLLQAYKELGDRDSYFRYTYERIHYKIFMKDILYFESRKRKIYIVTKKKEYEYISHFW